MLGLKDTKVQEGNSKFLQKGINSDGVVIGGFKYLTFDNGNKPYLELTLYKQGQSIEDGTKFKMYMTTDSAKDRTKTQIKHISTKVISEDELYKIDESSTNETDFANKLTAALGGKTIDEMMFGAEEYYNAEGKLKYKLFLPLPPFAHQNKDGVKPTRMAYDTSNPYLYKTATVKPDVESNGQKDDLPF